MYPESLCLMTWGSTLEHLMYIHKSKSKSQKNKGNLSTLRIIGPSYIGVYICTAGLRDLQTPSFEIPWFLGQKVCTQTKTKPNPHVSFIMFEKPYSSTPLPPPCSSRERTLGSSRKPANQQCCSSQSRPKEQFRSASLFCCSKMDG